MLSNALGYSMNYNHASEILDEIAKITPTFTNVSFEKLDQQGSIQWPCNDDHPDGTPTMHVDEFVRGKGKFFITEYIPTTEKVNKRFPLILTTGRILSQYNVGALDQLRQHNAGQFSSVSEAVTLLAQRTANLNEVLSSSQKRGQWGERLAEDMIRAAGLVEGVNYSKQDTTAAGGRPDFMFSFFIPWIVGFIILSSIFSKNLLSKKGTGDIAPIPPVFKPVSPSPIFL